MGYIYKIINNINGKLYIGKTINKIEDRFSKHIKNAEIYTNRYLYDAMNYYGYENFHIEKIEEYDNSKLNEQEIYWIKYYKTNDKNFGYNMTIGGDGGNTWNKNKNKEMTSIKLSLANRGKKRTKETCEKISKANKGKKHNYNKNPSIKRKENIIKERGYSTWEDRLNYISDCKKLFFQIPKEKCIKKEKHIHINKGKKYEEIYFSDLYIKEKKDMLSKKWMSNGNPNYVEIDKDILLKKILNNEKVEDIAKYFNISIPTVFSKCEKYFKTRKTREVRKIYGERNQ